VGYGAGGSEGTGRAAGRQLSVFTPVTEVASELSAVVTAVGLGGAANAELTTASAEDSSETASDWQAAGVAACGAAAGALGGFGGVGTLVGAGGVVGVGALVGVDVVDEDGSAARQPAPCAAMTALKRSPATGASLAGSGVGASAVWTLVNAVDRAATDGVLDVQAGVAAAGAGAADDTTEGTTTAAATTAASGSAKAHLRNMNPPCT
jgi:hypothetical protein